MMLVCGLICAFAGFCIGVATMASVMKIIDKSIDKNFRNKDGDGDV